MFESNTNYNGAFEDLYGDIKNLDDIFKKPSCPGDISSIGKIFEKPSCDGDIYDLDDIVGLIGYYPPVGRHVCELDEVGRLNNEDLLLVSQVSSHDDITEMTSKSVTFYDLQKRLLTDVAKALDLHTMAFKYPFQYAVSSHNHDSLYSRVSVELNPAASRLCSIAEIGISTDIIDSGRYDSIDENPAAARTNIEHFTMCVPDIRFSPPPRPMIGTIRFIGAAKMNDIINRNNLHVTETNVDPYDGSGVIRDDYDGWVFPNGSRIENKDNQLSAAASVYGVDADGMITLPNLRGFFKGVPVNGGVTLHSGDQQVGLKRHTHSADPSHWNFSGFHLDLNKTELKTTSDFGGRVYIHHGNDKLGTKDTDWRTSNVNIADAKFFPAIYTTETGESTGEPKPEHDIIPIMIYIGGERPEAN